MPYLRTLPQEVTDSNLKKMLHILWETPPYSSGGLATASFSIASALGDLASGKVEVISPTYANSTLEKLAAESELTHYRVELPSIQGELLDLNIVYKNPSAILSGLDLLEKYCSAPISPAQAHQLKSGPHYNSVTAFAAAVRDCHFTSYQSIHAHDWMTASAAVMARSSHFPKRPPLILHIHSTQLERHGLQSRGALYEHELWAMQQADAIITVSELSKSIITRYYEISTSKVHVAHNSSAAQPSSPPERAPRKHKTILFAARLVDQKSPELALEIISRVLWRTSNTKAIIAGDGDKLHAIRQLVKFKKLDDRIEVISHVPHERMHIVYASSDVLIIPSAHEPFGLVALEAALAGVAVVMSDHCGAAEVLTAAPTISNQNIELWTDTVTHLISNDSARAKLTDKLQQQARKSSWLQTAEIINKVVSKLQIHCPLRNE